jgi:hypothetical protein
MDKVAMGFGILLIAAALAFAFYDPEVSDEQIIAEWESGRYGTLTELSQKLGVSRARASKLLFRNYHEQSDQQ